jgi:ribonuclease HI
MLNLWTDGSAHAATRNGGWAYVITHLGDVKVAEASGSVKDTTNNRMEMQSVIEGLKRFDPTAAEVTVTSDSAYVINCFLCGWYAKWRKNGWFTASGAVKNRDLWEEMIELVEAFRIPIKWVHIRGHKGHKWNEHCDKLAGEARLVLERELQTLEV